MEIMFLSFIRLAKKQDEKQNPNYYIYKEFIIKILQKVIAELHFQQQQIINSSYSENNKKRMDLILSLNSEISQIIQNYDKSCTLENQLQYEKIIDSIYYRLK